MMQATKYITSRYGSTGTPVGMYVDVGTCPHQVLAATLTLSQLGGRLCPPPYCCPHQDLKATCMPAMATLGLKEMP